jgi:hypothetical protein
MKLKSCLTSCFARAIIFLFLLAMAGITFSPYILEWLDNRDVDHFIRLAHRWKVEAGEYLRRR